MNPPSKCIGPKWNLNTDTFKLGLDSKAKEKQQKKVNELTYMNLLVQSVLRLNLNLKDFRNT